MLYSTAGGKKKNKLNDNNAELQPSSAFVVVAIVKQKSAICKIVKLERRITKKNIIINYEQKFVIFKIFIDFRLCSSLQGCLFVQAVVGNFMPTFMHLCIYA